MSINIEELESLAKANGACAFGIADLDRLKEKMPDLFNRVGNDFSRAIVAGIRIQKAALEEITDKPTPIYFHNYRQVNYQLDSTALLIANKIQENGYRALAIPASQIISRDPMQGHISHKILGQSAGIGFIGRNTLLIHPEYGAQVRYVSILTDAPLKANEPFEGNCGSCRACMEVCPASAIKEKAEDFDLTACYRKLCEFTKISFIGQHICGVCVKACEGKKHTS